MLIILRKALHLAMRIEVVTLGIVHVAQAVSTARAFESEDGVQITPVASLQPASVAQLVLNNEILQINPVAHDTWRFDFDIPIQQWYSFGIYCILRGDKPLMRVVVDDQTYCHSTVAMVLKFDASVACDDKQQILQLWGGPRSGTADNHLLVYCAPAVICGS